MRRCARLGAVVALAGAGAVVAVGGGTAGAAPVTEEFEFTGEAQEFVVPADVCAVTIDAFGAEGGAGDNGAAGGEGGRATATIPVTPGETLAVYVGGQGESLFDPAATEVDEPDVPGTSGDVDTQQTVGATGGFNGGGDALDAGDNIGGGGGGGSDVRQGGTALENRVVVGGGGGGGGGDSDGGNAPESEGGDGGGQTGEDGQDSTDGTPGGGGGSQTAGGAAGAGDITATDGELGQGGTGGEGEHENDGGGGGGGGYYGGGGGAGDIDDTDNGGGGGGGSGFGPAGTEFETGNQFGDGLVIISYDPAVATCAAAPVVVEPTFTG